MDTKPKNVVDGLRVIVERMRTKVSRANASYRGYCHWCFASPRVGEKQHQDGCEFAELDALLRASEVPVPPEARAMTIGTFDAADLAAVDVESLSRAALIDVLRMMRHVLAHHVDRADRAEEALRLRAAAEPEADAKADPITEVADRYSTMPAPGETNAEYKARIAARITAAEPAPEATCPTCGKGLVVLFKGIGDPYCPECVSGRSLARYDGKKTAEAWTCSIAWEEELGRAEVMLYRSEARLKAARRCCEDPRVGGASDGDLCRPVRVTVTLATPEPEREPRPRDETQAHARAPMRETAKSAERKREKHRRRVLDRDHSVPRPCCVCGLVVKMCEPDRDGLFDDHERAWCEPCAAEVLALSRAADEPETKKKDDSNQRWLARADEALLDALERGGK